MCVWSIPRLRLPLRGSTQPGLICNSPPGRVQWLLWTNDMAYSPMFAHEKDCKQPGIVLTKAIAHGPEGCYKLAQWLLWTNDMAYSPMFAHEKDCKQPGIVLTKAIAHGPEGCYKLAQAECCPGGVSEAWVNVLHTHLAPAGALHHIMDIDLPFSSVYVLSGEILLLCISENCC